MRWLVFVKFLPGGSLPPDEFFLRINAVWSHVEPSAPPLPPHQSPQPKSGICIADFDSIEQFSQDLAIMPGAGISNVEIIPLDGAIEITTVKPGVMLSREN